MCLHIKNNLKEIDIFQSLKKVAKTNVDYPRELCQKTASLENIPNVYVSTGTTSNKGPSIFFVGSCVEKQQSADPQVTIHY